MIDFLEISVYIMVYWYIYIHFILHLSARMFYGGRGTAIIPTNPAVSDDEKEYDENEDDDDVTDPTYIPTIHNPDTPAPSQLGPSTSRRGSAMPALEVLEDDEEDEDYEEEEKRDKVAEP
ncbi:hypothetical protein E2C01_072210 [Portunus trituberculatus]|uniref:Uncharacterized protein n=1 Tax=Portunus trituberculatus TaxID=210409 RepID=A0A5B7I6J4_PORTR|nr:hypothetical protein [Portunus trituberculatus]